MISQSQKVVHSYKIRQDILLIPPIYSIPTSTFIVLFNVHDKKSGKKIIRKTTKKTGKKLEAEIQLLKNSWRNEDKGNKNQVLLRALGIDCHEKTGLQILLGSLYVIQQKDTLIPQFT